MAHKKKSSGPAAVASAPDAAVRKLLKKQEALVAELTEQVRKQRAKLKKAATEREELEARIEKHKARAKAAKRKYQAIKDHPVDAPSPVEKGGKAGPDTPVPVATTAEGPDASWTVARLRAEARARRVTGYSRLTKAELLDALT